MIRADTREQNTLLKSLVDKVEFLSYRGPDGQNYSFDLEVTTACGQVLTYERKAMFDAIASFGEKMPDGTSKLERQGAACTGIVVEWDDLALQMDSKWTEPKFRSLAEGTRKCLWRLSHRQPVIWTGSVQGTIDFLRYLERKDVPVEVR